jgi:two-component system chemotaxis response regulator CheB
MRRVLSDGLGRLGLSVVGLARSGEEALELCGRLGPDVLTLDLAMPGLDGLDVLRGLRARGSHVPVVVVSSFANGRRAIEALSEGAVELVPKPSAGEPLSTFLADLAEKLRIASAATVFPARPRPAGRPARHAARAPVGAAVAARSTAPTQVVERPAAPPAAGDRAPQRTAVRRTVVIACSTGGPRALAEVVPGLPARVGDGVVVVQHMPAGFTESLAERLDRLSRISVREARAGAALDPGTVWLAPGGAHLRFDGSRHLRLSDEAPVGGLRPRADLTIHDAAEAFGERLLLVVLTGMGRDGLEGAREVKRRGGRVLAEAESTCVVYGMPRAVVDADLADAVLPLPEIARAIALEATP